MSMKTEYNANNTNAINIKTVRPEIYPERTVITSLPSPIPEDIVNGMDGLCGDALKEYLSRNEITFFTNRERRINGNVSDYKYVIVEADECIYDLGQVIESGECPVFVYRSDNAHWNVDIVNGKFRLEIEYSRYITNNTDTPLIIAEHDIGDIVSGNTIWRVGTTRLDLEVYVRENMRQRFGINWKEFSTDMLKKPLACVFIPVDELDNIPSTVLAKIISHGVRIVFTTDDAVPTAEPAGLLDLNINQFDCESDDDRRNDDEHSRRGEIRRRRGRGYARREDNYGDFL